MDIGNKLTVTLSDDSLEIIERLAAKEEVSRSEFLNDLLLEADALKFLYSDLIDVQDTSIDYKKKMEDFGLNCSITEEEFCYHFEARSKDNMWGGSHAMLKMDIERARCSKEHAFRMGWKEVYMDIVRYFGRIF